MSKDVKPCPCGKGTYTIISEMDDWNRTRDSWEMNCADCKREYLLQTETAFDSGLSYERHFWARRGNVEKYEKLKQEANKLLKKAYEISETMYLEKWKNTFNGKNKKSVWVAITNNGEHYPSLGTFYKHVKDEGIEKYLESFFKRENSEALKILGISDENISMLRKKAGELEKEACHILKATS